MKKTASVRGPRLCEVIVDFKINPTRRNTYRLILFASEDNITICMIVNSMKS